MYNARIWQRSYQEVTKSMKLYNPNNKYYRISTSLRTLNCCSFVPPCYFWSSQQPSQFSTHAGVNCSSSLLPLFPDSRIMYSSISYTLVPNGILCVHYLLFQLYTLACCLFHPNFKKWFHRKLRDLSRAQFQVWTSGFKVKNSLTLSRRNSDSNNLATGQFLLDRYNWLRWPLI